MLSEPKSSQLNIAVRANPIINRHIAVAFGAVLASFVNPTLERFIESSAYRVHEHGDDDDDGQESQAFKWSLSVQNSSEDHKPEWECVQYRETFVFHWAVPTINPLLVESYAPLGLTTTLKRKCHSFSINLA